MSHKTLSPADREELRQLRREVQEAQTEDATVAIQKSHASEQAGSRLARLLSRIRGITGDASSLDMPLGNAIPRGF